MIAEVDGVLKFNNKTRDEMLKKNIGKYSQWLPVLTPAIGEYYDIDYDRQLKDLKDGKSLLAYTHDGESDYSEEINRKFFSFGEKEEYFVQPLTYGQLNPWIEFQSGNYIQYIDEVFGKDDIMNHVEYINNLLSGQYIENALRQTEVGVIKDINVAVAMQGIVTTNPNNMSGEDTTLGKISNMMYARTLYNGAIFNSDRMKAKIKVGENYYNKSYITPYLVNKYGNNLANVYELSDILRIDTNETGIREDLGADVHILDGYTENNFADLTKEEFRFLNEEIQSAIKAGRFDDYYLMNTDGILPRFMYSPVVGQGYVFAVKGTHDFRFKPFVLPNESNISLLASENNPNSGREAGKYNIPIYNEGEPGYSNTSKLERFDDSVDEFNVFDDNSVIQDTVGVDLISKTSRLFHENQIDTLVSRFHTSKEEYQTPEFTDTARSRFGNSHGRNLLTLDANIEKPTTNGYSNPYCRTWTYHHQYNQVKKLIRPFMLEKDGMERPYRNKEIQAMNWKYRAYRKDGETAINGYEDLANNSVLQSNGFVKITPKAGDTGSDVKKCMFSIENLAWKDVLKHPDNISKEQTGPNGGRIMWFPPYDLDFQESVNVDWNQNTFIGRGEKVYTYTNTDRTGTLSFSLLIDHPAIINSVTKNAYEGMGEEKDPEADILRFFAGCNLLPETSKIEDGGGGGRTPEPEPVPEPETISFKIYFPNNFTGIRSVHEKDFTPVDFRDYVLDVSDGGVVTNSYKQDDASDYWWQYLLAGSNTCLVTNPKYFRGYEMRHKPEKITDNVNNGISNPDDTFSNIILPTCTNNNYTTDEGLTDKFKSGYTFDNFQHHDGLSCTLDVWNNTRNAYRYHVDEDYHQVLEKEHSYHDRTSFQLNATFAAFKEGEIKDNEYTFTEVIMALLKIAVNPKYKALYEKYLPYVLDLGVQTARIDALASLFSDEDVTFQEIICTGSADKNDSKRAKILAMRRRENGSRLIKKLLAKPDLNVTVGKAIVGSHTGEEDAFSLKKERFCQFDITYIRKSKPLENTSNGKNGKEQDEESGQTSGSTMTFEEYVEAIKEHSPIIKLYDNCLTGNVEGMPSIDNYAFENNLREKFDKIEDKNRERLEDETFIKSEIDDIVDKYIDRDALILACSMSLGKSADDPEDIGNTNFRKAYFKTKEYGNPCTDTSTYPSDCYACLPDSTVNNPLIGWRENDDTFLDDSYLRYILGYLLSKNVEMDNYEDCEADIIEKSQNVEVDVVYDSDFRDIIEEDSMTSSDDASSLNVYIKQCNGINNIEGFPVDEGLGSLSENIRIYYNQDYETEGFISVDVHINESYLNNLLRQEEPVDLAIKDDSRYISFMDENVECMEISGRKICPVSLSYTIHQDGTYTINNCHISQVKPGKDLNEVNRNFRQLIETIFAEFEDANTYASKVEEFVEKYDKNIIQFVEDKIPDYLETYYGLSNTTYEYTLPKALDSYSDEHPLEIYHINVEKVVPIVILGHFLKDKYESFGVTVNDPEKDIWNYYTRLSELMTEHKSSLGVNVPEQMSNNMVKNHSTMTSEKLTQRYNAIFTSLTVDEEPDDEDIENGYGETILAPVTKLNQEIKDAEDAKKRAEDEANAQKIEQKRKEKEENKKKLEEEFNKDQVIAYGRDKNIPNMRYESEGEYFKNIEVTDPILFKNLKDKFKYFNPAYHAISPEGFNARLTFLHQCTRQGNTCETLSDGRGNNEKNKPGVTTRTAANLAFGRMPVCIIRIGDFIHTRAIINNMSISYAAANGVVWDLNSEGAGVQPMYAKISLGITLLGGQSLGAPVSRLQNAISFNYYANAEAYDNRADVAMYKSGQNSKYGINDVDYRRVWTPLNTENLYDNNGNLTDTVYFNNETDDFEKQHENDGTWKDLTDEQIDGKFNGDNSSGQTSGGTSGGTTQEMIYSPEITHYVMVDDTPESLEFFEDGAQIQVMVNKGYKDSGYRYSEYRKYTYSINAELKAGSTVDPERAMNNLKSEVVGSIMFFINHHP